MSKRNNLLVFSILLSLFTPVPAPFPKGDARAIFNPLIEPWWCIVPKFVRQLLVLKYFGTPLVENGPCSLDPAQHAPQGEPEGEPERGGAYAEPERAAYAEPERAAYAEPEPEPGYPEPEPEPRFGSQLRAEPEPEVGALRSRPEPEPKVSSLRSRTEPEPKVGSSKISPEPEPEIKRNPRFRLVAAATEPEPEGGKAAYPEPEPEPERVRQVRTSRGGKVPKPEAMSRDPSNKVYFIAA